MLVPAICYKDELMKQYDLLRYSDKAVYFNGCIEFGRLYINEEPSEGHFQYAIIEEKTKELVGYLGFHVDFYSQGVWGIGLINFREKPSFAITSAIREALYQIEQYDLHRIEFRAIEGNPAVKRYDKLINKLKDSTIWTAKKDCFNRVF